MTMRKVAAVALLAGTAVVGVAGTALADCYHDDTVIEDAGGYEQYENNVTSHAYGDVHFKNQYGLINNNGAPLVNADLTCAAPWVGTIVGGSLGNNYAACNTAEVHQIKTGGLLS